MKDFELPDFAKELFSSYDENPYMIHSLLCESKKIKEAVSSYFSINDITPEKETDICNEFNSLVELFARKDFTNQTLTLGADTYDSIEGLVDYANKIISDAFENEDESLELEAKAVSVLILSGLDKGGSNLLGVYNLILLAILHVAQAAKVPVMKYMRQVKNEIHDTNIEATAQGSISKCSILGKKLETNSSDTFASADDEKYTQRVGANVRDNMRANSKEYKLLHNQYLKVYGKLRKENDDPKTINKKTSSELAEEANRIVNDWQENGGYKEMVDRLGTHSARVSNPTTNAAADEIAFF